MTTEEKAPTIPELFKNLNKKQQEFCESYLTNGYNQASAATSVGYSPNSARVQGHRLLQDDNIKRYIDAVITETIGADLIRLKGRVLAEFESLGFSDIKHILDDSGNIDLNKLKDIDTRCIKSIQTDVVTIGKDESIKVTEKVRVTYHDKQKPLEILAKYTGLVVERLEVDVNHKGNVKFDHMSEAELDKIIDESEKI